MKIKLSRYPEGKKRAVTFSYDDGRIHDIRVIEILNKYNLKGTFHLNSYRYTEYAKDNFPEKGGIVPPDKLKEVYAGHEISSHTFSHPDMCALNANQLRDEVIEDRKFLEEKAGYVVRGMSYPFGTYNDYVLNALKYYGIEYSRTTKATNKFDVPDDFLMWHPTCHHRNALSLVEDFDNPRWRLMSLFYIWGHSYEFDQENNWEMFEEICKSVSGKEDVWYATNIEIVDYVNALRGLKFSADSTMVYNPSAVDVYFETKKSDNDDWNVVKVCAGEHADLSK